MTVGKSKTEHGTGRVVPLNKTAMAALTAWAQQFPDRKPAHYVFPSERVGFSGNDEIPQVFDTDPTKAITSWKVAWTTARRRQTCQCRLHDFRHTCITRLLERGVPLSVVASLMGWSPATTTRMAKRYAHFGDATHRQAMESLDPVPVSPSATSSRSHGTFTDAASTTRSVSIRNGPTLFEGSPQNPPQLAQRAKRRSREVIDSDWLLGLDSNQQPSG